MFSSPRVCAKPDKQTPSLRLAAAALDVAYGRAEFEPTHASPMYAGQSLLSRTTSSTTIRGDGDGDGGGDGGGDGATVVVVKLSRRATARVPPWATASSTLGKPGSVPRNACPVAMMPPFHNPQDCGWPRLYARNSTDGKETTFNATAELSTGGHAIRIFANLPPGFQVVASSMGRASWPMTIFFSEEGVPVLPWYAELNETLPWVPPSTVEDVPFEYELDEPWVRAEPSRVPF